MGSVTAFDVPENPEHTETIRVFEQGEKPSLKQRNIALFLLTEHLKQFAAMLESADSTPAADRSFKWAAFFAMPLWWHHRKLTILLPAIPSEFGEIAVDILEELNASRNAIMVMPVCAGDRHELKSELAQFEELLKGLATECAPRL